MSHEKLIPCPLCGSAQIGVKKGRFATPPYIRYSMHHACISGLSIAIQGEVKAERVVEIWNGRFLHV